MQSNRTGVGDTERVEKIVQPEGAELVVGLGALNVEKGRLAEFLAGVGIVIDVIVGQQRMQPVDCSEVLGEAVGRIMMIGQRLGNAGGGVSVDQPQPRAASANRSRAGRSNYSLARRR